MYVHTWHVRIMSEATSCAISTDSSVKIATLFGTLGHTYCKHIKLIFLTNCMWCITEEEHDISHKPNIQILIKKRNHLLFHYYTYLEGLRKLFLNSHRVPLSHGAPARSASRVARVHAGCCSSRTRIATHKVNKKTIKFHDTFC